MMVKQKKITLLSDQQEVVEEDFDILAWVQFMESFRLIRLRSS